MQIVNNLFSILQNNSIRQPINGNFKILNTLNMRIIFLFWLLFYSLQYTVQAQANVNIETLLEQQWKGVYTGYYPGGTYYLDIALSNVNYNPADGSVSAWYQCKLNYSGATFTNIVIMKGMFYPQLDNAITLNHDYIIQSDALPNNMTWLAQQLTGNVVESYDWPGVYYIKGWNNNGDEFILESKGR